uniref:Ribosomal protein L6 n=1 Tax=Apophlaea sinclairii TaxID=212746 RepID=A0A1C9CBX1_9FLOR|nr:ribosomal protein L6 [Apophlaea sinclairii]AOM65865.1 ribosomal protein L6 [Apophlaea sinclairii]
MSRIGTQPIPIPSKVKVSLHDRILTTTGPQGDLQLEIPNSLTILIKSSQLILHKNRVHQIVKATHGLYRTLINNMIIGVNQGFSKHLILRGVGYRAQMNNKDLVLNVGYSHIVTIVPPTNIKITTLNNLEIVVSGPDKTLVGELSAQIRGVKPPEPYKGKGIRYKQELINHKIGKTGK